MLRVSRSTIYEGVRRGKVRSIRIGRRWLIPRRVLEALLEGQ